MARHTQAIRGWPESAVGPEQLPCFRPRSRIFGGQPDPRSFCPPLGRAGQPVGPWGCWCRFCHGLSVRPRSSLLPPGPPAQIIAVSHVDSSLPHCELCRLVAVVAVVDIMEILVGSVLPWGPPRARAVTRRGQDARTTLHQHHYRKAVEDYFLTKNIWKKPRPLLNHQQLGTSPGLYCQEHCQLI